MSLRGVVHGRTIELEEDPHLPDGTTVEVELAVASQAQNPFWGLLANQPDLVQTLRQMVEERAQQRWRTPDEDGILFQV